MTAAPASRAAMDRIYRHQRRIYDVTRKYYLLGRDRLIGDLSPGHGTVLEIGCGTGRNLVATARRHGAARIWGIDVSSTMLDTTRAALARRRLEHRVTVAEADATTLDTAALFGRRSFDRVYISYVLSMIPDWRAALERAVEALGAGGRLHIVDFGHQEGLPAPFKRLLFRWLALFHVHPIADLPRGLEEIAARRGLTLRCHSLYRGYAVYAVLERR